MERKDSHDGGAPLSTANINLKLPNYKYPSHKQEDFLFTCRAGARMWRTVLNSIAMVCVELLHFVCHGTKKYDGLLGSQYNDSCEKVHAGTTYIPLKQKHCPLWASHPIQKSYILGKTHCKGLFC